MNYRIEKFVAEQLGITRSEAKKLLYSNKVFVNGLCVNKIGVKINSDTDVINVNGKQITYKKFIYLLLNKPAGVLSASRDKNKKTVLDLVPEKYRNRNLFPVGRLDKDTTGLLIITDDGDFAHKVISPKSHIKKTYSVTLDGKIPVSAVDTFKNGVVLHSGEVCMPADLEIISDNCAKVTVCEGKYHQIKRMFGTLNLGVEKLHRESIGSLKIPDTLDFGEICELQINELSIIC